MIKTLTNQTIALAGLSQALFLVREIAQHGRADSEDLETCLSSLLKINADSVPEVYGGVARLRTGLSLLEKQLGNAGPIDAQLAHQAKLLVDLEGKFRRRVAMQKSLRAGLERATVQAAHFSVVHDNVLATFAELYQNSISQLRPRIIVYGESRFLENTDNANKIRALLLAGIRSVWLWRQCGGGKLGLLLNHARLHAEVRQLLHALSRNVSDHT